MTAPVVLLVEDDANDVLLATRAFTKASLQVDLRRVGNGQEAMDYLSGTGPYADRERHPAPSLVLLDLKLPRRSGLEVLAWMRSRPDLAGVRVVCLTSSREEKDVARAYALGASHYFVKPPAFPDLVEQLRAIGRWQGLLGGAGPLPSDLGVPRPA